jgi:hypothetical protein
MWIQEGQKIEIQGIEDGFYGAWFFVTVSKTFLEKCLVKYDEFVNENDNSKHLCGMVQISQLRLVPLNINNTSWVENDVIEIYESNCWWVGKIIHHLLCETKYVVYFLESLEEM